MKKAENKFYYLFCAKNLVIFELRPTN